MRNNEQTWLLFYLSLILSPVAKKLEVKISEVQKKVSSPKVRVGFEPATSGLYSTRLITRPMHQLTHLGHR